MTGLEIFAIGALAFGIGILIGCVGIGGVLLVPMLAYIFNIPVHASIAASMFAYIFSGMVGTIIYARHGSIRWKMAILLIAGAGPSAFIGAAVLSKTPGIWVEVFIASLILAAGTNALINNKEQSQDFEPKIKPAGLIGMGAVTGIGSAMTGTGGPLVLIPMAVWLRYPTLTAIGLSQAVQFPIALLATAGNMLYGNLDWLLGSVLASALILGAAIGARLAHAVPRNGLRSFLSWVLVVTGFLILGQLGYSHLILD